MNLAAYLSLNTSGFGGPLAGARAAFSGFTGLLRNSIGPLMAVTAALAGVASVGGIFAKSIEAAAADESLTAKLTVLTKSAKTAQSVLKDLNKFSDDTPFEPEPIMKAGVALIGAKFAARDVRDLLQDMGDLASGGIGDLSANLDEVTSAFARLKSGQSGEAMEIFRRFSIATEDLKAKGLKFDAGGQLKSGAEEALTAVRAIIKERFGGTMAAMAKTTEGLWSTLQGNIGAVFREFGKPLLAPLKEALQAAIGYSGVLSAKAQEWGVMLGEAAQIGVQLFQNGQIGDAAGLSLKIGFGEATNFLSGALKGIFVASISLLRDGLIGAMSMLGNDRFFKGLELAIVGIAGVLSGELKKALADAFGGLSIFGKSVLSPEQAQSLRDMGSVESQDGAGTVQGAGMIMSKALEGSGTALFDSLITAWDKFTFEVKDTKIVDTEGLRGDLQEIVSAAKAQLTDAAAKVAAEVPSAIDETATSATAAAGKATKIEDGDRFTKIGGLVSGGGGIADASRKTAAATERTAAYVLQLINVMGRLIEKDSPMPGATWAVA